MIDSSGIKGAHTLYTYVYTHIFARAAEDEKITHRHTQTELPRHHRLLSHRRGKLASFSLGYFFFKGVCVCVYRTMRRRYIYRWQRPPSVTIARRYQKLSIAAHRTSVVTDFWGNPQANLMPKVQSCFRRIRLQQIYNKKGTLFCKKKSFDYFIYYFGYCCAWTKSGGGEMLMKRYVCNIQVAHQRRYVSVSLCVM